MDIKRNNRFKALEKAYHTRNDKVIEKDDYDKYIIDLLTDLGIVYDSNFDKIVEMNKKLITDRDASKLKLYQARERILDGIGTCLRKAIMASSI